MVFPITGPTYAALGISSASDAGWRRQWWRYKQVKPYNLNLPYKVIFTEILSAVPIGQVVQSIPAWVNPWVGSNYARFRSEPITLDNPVVVRHMSVARAGLNTQLSDFASWAQALVERQQTMDLMTKRLVQFGKFLLAVKRGRFGDAYAIIRPSGSRRNGAFRNSVKSAGNLWLEWWFGIHPILVDIKTSKAILETPFGPKAVESYSKEVIDEIETILNYGTFGYESIRSVTKGKVKVRCNATVWIDNPNSFLTSRMGFTNPLLLAYEVVPFSFVANWFINIEEWLRRFDGHHGITIDDPYYSVRSSITVHSQVKTILYGYPEPYDGVDVTGASSSFERVRGLPEVTLGFRPPWDLSKTRGLTAASLIVQRMRDLPWSYRSRLF